MVCIDMRQVKGQGIARTAQIEKAEGGWLVPSQNTDQKYLVQEDFTCNCADSVFHKTTCKHAYAVRFYLARETTTPEGVKTEKMRLTYKQAWGAYNRAQKEEITVFDKLLSDLVQEVEEPAQDKGRPRLSLQESVFCAVQKVYSQLSSRRAYSLYKNAEGREQIGQAPHYNAINKLLNRTDLTPILHELVTLTSLPLKTVETQFAIDSTGFSTKNFGQYCESKYHLGREHRWLKAHICVGVKTNTVTAVEVTDEHGADSTQFAPLVQKTAEKGFNMQEVSADKAYMSRANYETVRAVGGTAYIPFTPRVTGEAHGSLLWKKMFLYFQLHQEEFMAHYHKRSNVESTFSMIKTKFGEQLKSKNPKAQENELLCKFIAHNIVVLIHEMHEMKINPSFSL